MTKEEISDLIYDSLDYMYCDNCRCNSEIDVTDDRWGCEDCHRKYNGWGISRQVCDSLAKLILEK